MWKNTVDSLIMAVPQFFGLAFLGLPLIFDWKLVKTKYFEFIQRIFENVKIDSKIQPYRKLINGTPV